MNETTADNRPASLGTERSDTNQTDTHHTDAAPVDPLDRVSSALDGLEELDPAEAVAVLADITAELNKELDSDTDRS